MYTVYGFRPSGNCYKVQLLLALIDQPHVWVDVDSTAGETRTPGFLAKNPNGRVPLLELPDGRCLPESNAILCFLAEGSAYLPEDRWQRAQVLQWLFFEQYSHEPYIAVARYICGWMPADSPRRAELPRLLERGYQALSVMEEHLTGARFFVGDHCTVADIALHAYTHDAARGGFDLQPYPAVRAWLARVEAQPRFVPQTR